MNQIQFFKQLRAKRISSAIIKRKPIKKSITQKPITKNSNKTIKLDSTIVDKAIKKFDNINLDIKRIISTINRVASLKDFSSAHSELKIDIDILKEIIEDIKYVNTNFKKVNFSTNILVDLWKKSYNLIDRVQNSVMARVIDIAEEKGFNVTYNSVPTDDELFLLYTTIDALEDVAVNISVISKEILYKN